MPSIFSEVSTISALYLHIPFCKKVCPFCSFAVQKDNPQKHALYLELLKKEFSLLKKQGALNLDQIESVYLGGGTPSVLTIVELHHLLNWVQSDLLSGRTLSFAMEVNPEHITKEHASCLKQAGCSRISLGVQSFNKHCLKTLKREHTPEQANIALDICREVGIKDINIDLMFGYPGQTFESLNEDLTIALSYQPEHISVYSLTIEPKTAVYRNSDWKNWVENNEKMIVESYEKISGFLRSNGYLHYEVSNFCKDGYQSQQNLIYWKGGNYLGLGIGAHSHVFPLRWGNHRRWVDYKSALQGSQLPHDYLESLTLEMQRDEVLMLGLRLAEGIDLQQFSEKFQVAFSQDWRRKIDQFQQKRLVRLENSYLIPTVKGLLFADEIASSLAACFD